MDYEGRDQEIKAYNQIGLTAAGIFSISPVFMLYATSARGYSWVMLFTVWMLLLALRLQAGTDRAAWLLLVVCGALVVVYPGGRETLENVLEWVGPDAAFLNMDTVTLLQRFPEAELYAVEARHELVEEAFP